MNKELVEKLKKRTLHEDLIADLKKQVFDYIVEAYNKISWSVDPIGDMLNRVAKDIVDYHLNISAEDIEDQIDGYNADWCTDEDNDFSDVGDDFYDLEDTIIKEMAHYFVDNLFAYADEG